MAKKTLTPLERRQKDIDDRAARVAALAKKKNMTVPELRKQERDTFINVVGGAASLLPIGAIVRGATALLKGGKAVSTAVKGAKTAKTAKTTLKPTTAASQSNRGASQGGRTAAQAKPTGTSVTKAPGTAVKPKGTSVTPSARSSKTKGTAVGPARPPMKNVTPKAKPTTPTPKSKIVGLSNKGKVAAAVTAGLGAAALLASGKDKNKAEAAVSSPTPRPAKPTKKPSLTYRGGQRKAAPKKGSYDTEKKQIKKGPGVGKQDKLDPRKNFKSTPVKNAALPAGAKPFQGSYNSKTHKLQNIRGKTYVVKK